MHRLLIGWLGKGARIKEERVKLLLQRQGSLNTCPSVLFQDVWKRHLFVFQFSVVSFSVIFVLHNHIYHTDHNKLPERHGVLKQRTESSILCNESFNWELPIFWQHFKLLTVDRLQGSERSCRYCHVRVLSCVLSILGNQEWTSCQGNQH